MRKIIVPFLFFAAFSCINEANCVITSTNLVKIPLINQSDGTAATIKFNSITVPDASLIFYKDVSVTGGLVLPVNPDSEETTFVFDYTVTAGGVDTNKINTLTVGYTTEVRLIAADCGAFQYQTNLEIINTDFVKTKLINTSLLTAVPSNLEIYF